MDNQGITTEEKIEKKPLSFFWIFKTTAKAALNALKELKFSKKYLVIVAVVIALLLVTVILRKSDLRLDMSLRKINYQAYNHVGPDFSFRYPDYYVFDGDEQQKYGASYIGGFRLKSDARTGCDMRQSESRINFKKSDQEIREALQKDFEKSVKNFNLIKTERIKLGGEDAFVFEFSFTDPTGSTVHLAQIITGHEQTGYLLVCGTGDYQYKYVQKDFADFLNSFQWKSQL